MDGDAWTAVLIAALGLNAALGFSYRVYRLTKGGPIGDVVGQAILGVVLVLVSISVAADTSWARWVALGYACLFGVVVMPLWVLAVLIPIRPSAIDYAFTGVYWAALGVIAVAAIAL